MTNGNDIFEEPTPAPQAASEAPAQPEDLLKAIVAPDGRQKYTDIPTALKSLAHSQEHIQKLEAEKAELLKKLESAKTVDEVLQEIKAGVKPVEKPATGAVNPTEIESVVQKVLEGTKAEETRKANRLAVSSELIKQMGDAQKAADALKAKSEELGIDLRALAEASPKAVLAYFKPTDTALPTKTNGSVNTAALGNQNQPPKPKNVMFGATSKDIMDSWRAAKPQ